MQLFFQVILPIIAVFGTGYILQRFRVLDVKSIAAVSIYIFLPALVFTTLYESSYNQGFTTIIIFAFVLLAFIIMINRILKIILKWEQSVESASILTSAFMNGGNYGVPVILYSIGDEAMPYAVFFMVLQTLIMSFFGVYYASRSTSGMKQAFYTVLKMPATHATILAFIFQQIDWEIPESVYSPLSMLADAAIPLMMVVLGMQLASIKSLSFNWPVLSSAVLIRMVISPLIAFGFISFVSVDPVIAAVILIVSAMPSAATTTMYAIEFDTEPDLVSSITLVTTIVSIVSVTILLNLIA
ncbi:AEC family transporter [Oceanobacillus halotolerans]|uniref:AEC family transporter n=1 Tax=Oceanobacillus halotolerans TaxID=2663380 RepID=UPI0013DAE52A|nr:AEC family transporter [Oceanobacillus halotolerans]